MYDGLCKIGEAVGTDRQELTLEKVFPQLESVSIDYGIMEKAKDIERFSLMEYDSDDILSQK